VRYADILEHCVAKPGAYLDNPWGEEAGVVKVGGKIFCFLGSAEGPATISAKNTPEGIEEWRARYPAHIGTPRYLRPHLWSRIIAEGAGAPDDDDVRELIDDSYHLIVASLPRSKRPHRGRGDDLDTRRTS
jgi:predicted DNA-binding protein (MmcQ/YjbR family)